MAEPRQPNERLTELLNPWDRLERGVSRTLVRRRTRFQEIEIVESSAYGKALLLDGRWQSSVADEFLYHEALVHPSMILRGEARRVLILGGAEGATLREVLRWKTVEKAVVVDIDGEVVAACREHLPEMHQGAFEDPRAEVRIADADAVLGERAGVWDVILADLSDPVEKGPAVHLFTRGAFTRLRAALAPGGVAAIQAGPVDPVDLPVHARLVRTLAAVFPVVRSYAVGIGSMACTLGFALASTDAARTFPSAEAIDRLLAEGTTGGVRMIDGLTVTGLLATPKHVRDAIAAASFLV